MNLVQGPCRPNAKERQASLAPIEHVDLYGDLSRRGLHSSPLQDGLLDVGRHAIFPILTRKEEKKDLLAAKSRDKPPVWSKASCFGRN